MPIGTIEQIEIVDLNRLVLRVRVDDITSASSLIVTVSSFFLQLLGSVLEVPAMQFPALSSLTLFGIRRVTGLRSRTYSSRRRQQRRRNIYTPIGNLCRSDYGLFSDSRACGSYPPRHAVCCWKYPGE